MIGAAKPLRYLDFTGVLHPSLATADQYPAYIGAGCSLELSFKTTLRVVAVLHLKATRRTRRYDVGLKEKPLDLSNQIFKCWRSLV